MRNSYLFAALVLAAACHGDGFEGDAVLIDDSSDEVLTLLVDTVDRGELTVDDQLAAQMIAPTDGSEFAAAGDPPTFSWAERLIRPTHGRATGDFVWLRIACTNMVPIDVLTIETREYTPDPDRWLKITESGGSCTSTLTSAFVDRGIIMEGGPFQPSVNPAFTISQ